MIHGIKVNFSNSKTITDNHEAEIDFNSKVSEFECIVQDSLINTVVINGSDKFEPEKGTNLLSNSFSSLLVDNDTKHEFNFASLATRYFMNLNIPNPDLRIKKYSLVPKTFIPNGILFNAFFESNDGQQIGREITS